MRGNGLLGIVTSVLLVGVLIGLFVLIFQIDTLEQRFIQQASQLRELGEASDRIAARMDRLAAGGMTLGNGTGAARDPYADVKVRHPEVENLLEPSEFSFSNPDAPQDGVLYRGWPSGDPKGFNPLTENAADLSSGIEAYAGATLATRMSWTDPDRWTGDLAWRVEVTDEFREFTIYLKRDVQWHTPGGVDVSDAKYAWLAGRHPVTAHDVVFTLDMLMHPQVENGFIKSYYQDLEKWEALDDHTVRIRWARSLYGNLESTVAIAAIPRFLWGFDERGEPFPEEAIGLRFNQHWYNNKGFVGSGPYRMTDYEPGVRIVLDRNEDFVGEKPAIKRIEYPIYTDPKRTLLMLKARELTYGGLLPSEYREEILRWQDVPEAKRPKNSPFLNGQIECTLEDRPAYSYLGWNAERTVFRDARVRRAMTHAFDRRRIIDEIYVGLGEIATGPFLPSSPFNDPTIEPLPFDLQRAAELLAEAGWVDSNGDGLVDRDPDPDDGDAARKPFEFTLLLYGNAPEWLSAANVFQQDLLSIGVRMKIDSAEWSLMQKRMDERDFDAFSGGWLMGWEQDPYQLWHSSQADLPRGSNKVAFRNARADVLIEKLRETFDRDERVRMLREFHRIIHDEQAYTFFRVPKAVSCWQRELKNVVFAITRPRANSLPWWVEAGP